MVVAFDARDALGPRLRGWGRYARELHAALERAGPARGVHLHTLARGWPGPELAWEQVGLPLALRRARVDAVHVPNCFLPLRRPCPGIVTVHDLAFEAHPEDFAPRTAWKYRTFAPRAARSAECVICVSQATADDLVRRYGIEEGKVRVIPPAAALPLTTAEPPPGPYLLAVGDLRRKKNLVRLVEAFRTLRGEGLPHRLVLAGADAGEGARIRAAAGDAPVEITGWVDDERLDALMRGADCLVHPSVYEGFGLVLVEAMARGVPVAAARATALPETGADACAYFDPLDPADIARALRELLSDAATRERLAERGRARAAEFSWERAAAETADVYLEVAA